MLPQQIDSQGHSPLLTCPADLWNLILKSLSAADHTRLCLVNKSMRDFVEPYLYANVQWAWTSNVQATSIILFVRSIVRRPQLGLYVQSLALMGTSSHGGIDTIPLSLLENGLENGDLSASLPSELLNTSGTSGKTWNDQLHAGSVDAVVALLISHLPNLTSLHLGPRFTRDNSCLGIVLRSALCDPNSHGLPRFQHLRHVTFKTGPIPDSARPMRQENVPNVLALFYLPCIERLSTSFDSPELLTWPAPQGQPAVSLSLTELDLARPFRAAHLGSMLAVAPNLKSLRWSWYHGGVTSPYGDNAVIDLDQIAAALSLVRESLTELIITAVCTIGANKNFEEPSSKGSLKALAGFPRLRNLQAPVVFLMGWSRDDPHRTLSDVVPKTVESIAIMDELWYHHLNYTWRERSVLDVIKTWLADPGKLPPNLRHCRLFLKNSAGLELEPQSEELRALGARVGVKVEISRQRRKCSVKWIPRTF